ncbi:MAG: flagellin [bacterium]|nr:flagellin [bacterium]
MSLRINHNTAAINAHRNLQANDAQMGKTLEKLSSGLKINRAADGPAALVISEQMRGQIVGLQQAIDNSETAVSLVQTTEANLNEVSRMLVSVRQLAVHAANEGVNDETMLEADQQEINNALATIDRIANQAQFGNKRLLDGSQGASGSTTGVGLEFAGSGLKTKDSRESGYEVKITQNASKASVQGTVALTDELVQGGETFTLIENGKMASYTTRMDDNVQTALKNLESEVNRNGLNIDLALSDNGTLEVKHKEYGSAYGFQFSSSTAGVLSKEAGQIEVSNAGMDIKGTINGESAIGEGQVLTGMEGTANVDGLQVRYTGQAGENGEIPEGGVEVGRAYVSQNSMNFQVGGNYGQTVGISVESVNTRTMANNIENESGFRSLADVDVRTFQGAQDALRLVDDAITRLSSRRGDLGAFQKNTLESNLNNLKVAHENLVSSESILRDVDMAKEMATFTRNQIMSQSATAMLAQANQTPSNVLQLLK